MFIHGGDLKKGLLRFFAVSGVENFERIKTTLKKQLPPEKFVENKQETA